MAENKKGRGCFFYGCLTLAVIAVIGVITIYFAGRYFLKKGLEVLTSNKPVAVEPVHLSPKEGDEAVKRLNEFTRLAREKKTTGPLELSSDELDYIVRNSQQGGQLREAIHLVITNSEIHGQLSFPLGVARPQWNGRYLNGEATFGISLQGGALVLNPKSLKVGGVDVPQDMLMQVGAQQSLRWPAQPNEPGAEWLNNLSKVEVKDDKIVLYPKP